MTELQKQQEFEQIRATLLRMTAAAMAGEPLANIIAMASSFAPKRIDGGCYDMIQAQPDGGQTCTRALVVEGLLYFWHVNQWYLHQAHKPEAEMLRAHQWFYDNCIFLPVAQEDLPC
jgi:hypothetical protein